MYVERNNDGRYSNHCFHDVAISIKYYVSVGIIDQH
jgi:hypothetical protein